MQADYLQRQFWAAMQQCNAVEGPCLKSCEDTDLDCFVIDNNGFVLISERPQEMGRLLGEADGALMKQLLSMGVFSRVTMYDYQAMCKPPDHHHSAAESLFSPLSAFLMVARWLLHECLLFLLEWSAWGSWQDKGSEAHKHKKQDLLHPCDTEYPVFVHQTAIQEANGIIECGGCQKAPEGLSPENFSWRLHFLRLRAHCPLCCRTFVMQQIPRSNLLLLVTDRTCDCSAHSPILQEATEVKYNASVKCDRMRSQKPRRRPGSCHAFHPEENAQDCGGASDTLPSSPLLLLSLGAWLLPPQLLW